MFCRRWVPLAALALALLPAGSTFAQVKPKIMIIFDTSGSMQRDSANVETNGDGSPLCAGVGTTSRVYQLKTALFEVLQGMGNSEVDFALATYPMKVDPNFTPACFTTCTYQGQGCSGHYINAASQSSEYVGTALGGCKISTHLACAADTDCGSGGTCCQKTTGCGLDVAYHTCTVANPLHLNGNCGTVTCPWYNDYKTEVLKVPFNTAATPTTIENLLWYVDQKEDTGAVPALTNPEIRIHPFWYTPLGKSLFYAHGYFDKEVALPTTDYAKKCERLVIAFFTDGLETCNTAATDPFYAQTWAQKLFANPKLKVTTHTVGIDIPAAMQGNIKDIATQGGGSYYNVTGTTASLKAAFLDIIAKSQPPSELCNELDDDCDGKSDEDFPQKGQVCDNGLLGECFQTGTYICNTTTLTGVVCNAAKPAGVAEVCDGKDNNCNGQIDENLPGCVPLVCQPEVCNGKDDDCDTVIDNGFVSVPCGANVGECKAGVTKCVAGKVICDGGVLGGTEVCDNKDNDCDGVVDKFSVTCYDFASGCDLPTNICKGVCKIGTKICEAGVFGECLGDVGPSKEMCNLIDDDCNGLVDDNAECANGGQCINGACTQKCGTGEFNCPPGQLCTNGWCVPDKCDALKCDQEHPGWLCKGGECIDPCANKTCDPGFACKKGICVDTSCYGTGCPAGQKCVQGVCQADPCSAMTCGPTEQCAGGKCIPLCDTKVCGPGESCKVTDSGGGNYTTTCAKDLCLNINCPEGSVCSKGSCIPDPCRGMACDSGKVCVDGTCVADPCEMMRCPAGYSCKAGQCTSPFVEGTTDVFVAGGGGTACAVTDLGGASPGLPTFLLMLGLVVLALGRRTWRD